MFGDKFNLGNLGALMKNAKKLQEMAEQKQAELESTIIHAESGAGAVKITMTAKHVCQTVEIDDEILKEDKAIVQDLIAAAINDASAKIDKIMKDQMSDISGLLGG